MLRLLVVLMGLLMIYTTNSYRLHVHEGEETLLTLLSLLLRRMLKLIR